ncbi:WD40 repeat-like protein [Aureobasidium pullulans]|uniref:WD40 repeat-like protein n=1 Tax=Aureobasidium pullulans TaxID=5580 RepID=A0A4S8SLV1_AURPU|nr:WD40 repeat-like protein [Aureobasidium pullulans]
MPSMSRQHFLGEFIYGVEKHFDVDGTEASWAQASRPAHRFWGNEDDRIEFPCTSDDYHTTQRGSRPAEELPKVVVYDFMNKSQKQVLSGHEDLVTWTSFSPDNSHIASASWDGTYRIFDSTTGDCKHIIGPIGGQCSSGAWSPDSAHIIVRGNGRRVSEDIGAIESYSLVAVYSAMTGEEVTQFKHRRDSRSRSGQIAWSSRDEIAISHETDIWIWKPLEDKVISSFSLSADNSMLKAFARFNKISWAKDGQLLIVMSGDHTIEVWDRVLNVKWTLQRPQGLTTKRDGYLRFYNVE